MDATYVLSISETQVEVDDFDADTTSVFTGLGLTVYGNSVEDALGKMDEAIGHVWRPFSLEVAQRLWLSSDRAAMDYTLTEVKRRRP
jgi:hypothetical protein